MSHWERESSESPGDLVHLLGDGGSWGWGAGGALGPCRRTGRAAESRESREATALASWKVMANLLCP